MTRKAAGTTDPSIGGSAVTLVNAFELGFVWRGQLTGQNLEDSRAVGRTLTTETFDGLNLDLSDFNSFRDADSGIVDCKRRIIEALRRQDAAETAERQNRGLTAQLQAVERDNERLRAQVAGLEKEVERQRLAWASDMRGNDEDIATLTADRDRLQGEVERLERENAEALETVEGLARLGRLVTDSIDPSGIFHPTEMRTRIATLEREAANTASDRDHYKALAERMDKALEPFARANSYIDAPELSMVSGLSCLTVADFRAAASARTMEKSDGE